MTTMYKKQQIHNLQQADILEFVWNKIVSLSHPYEEKAAHSPSAFIKVSEVGSHAEIKEIFSKKLFVSFEILSRIVKK